MSNVSDLATTYGGASSSLVQHQPDANNPSDWGAVSQAATENRTHWEDYLKDQRKFGGFFGLGNQRNNIGKPGIERAPNPDDFEGGEDDAGYQQAVRDWYNKNGNELHTQGTPLDSKNFNSQSGAQNALSSSAQTDIAGLNDTQDQNIKTGTQIADAFSKDVTDTTSKWDAKRIAEQDAANTRINGSMDQAKAGVQPLIDTAKKNLDDLNARFDMLYRQTFSDEGSALSEFRNNTAAMVEQTIGSVRQAASASAKETVARLQSMGYGLDSPQATSELRKIAGAARETIGGTATKAWADYNATKLDKHQAFSQARSILGAAGLATLSEGQGHLDTAMTSAAQILDHIEEWGAHEKNMANQTAATYSSLMSQMEISGQDSAAKMLFATTRRQWIPMTPFAQQLYDNKFRADQANTANNFAWLGVAMQGVDLLGKLEGWGAYAPPKQPSSSEQFLSAWGANSAGYATNSGIDSIFGK